MKKHLLVSCAATLAAALVPALALAQVNVPPVKTPPPTTTDKDSPNSDPNPTPAVPDETPMPFADVDKDKNGTISRDEAKSSKGSKLADRFPTLDTNGDGSLDTREYKGYANQSAKGGSKDGSKSAATFSTMDANSDGELSHAEIKGDSTLQSNFKSADKDRNGTLSRQEYAAFEASASKDGASANTERKSSESKPAEKK